MGASNDHARETTTTMSKVREYGGLVIEEFGSMGELVRAIREREPNRHYAGKYRESKAPTREWNGNVSLDEACNLFLDGWDEPLDRIKTDLTRRVHVRETAVRTRTENRYNVVGHTPSVPRAIQGLPTSMVETRRVPMKQRTVHLMFDATVDHTVKVEEVIRAGVVALEAVTLLSGKGYAVKLSLVSGQFPTIRKPRTQHKRILSGEPPYGFSFVLKDYRQPLDLKKVCFPLAHPAMTRRIGFAVQEVSTATTAYDERYGTPVGHRYDDKMRRDMLRDGAYLFTYYDVAACGFDTDRLLTALGIAE